MVVKLLTQERRQRNDPDAVALSVNLVLLALTCESGAPDDGDAVFEIEIVPTVVA